MGVIIGDSHEKSTFSFPEAVRSALDRHALSAKRLTQCSERSSVPEAWDQAFKEEFFRFPSVKIPDGMTYPPVLDIFVDHHSSALAAYN
jgi:hypothetical protein